MRSAIAVAILLASSTASAQLLKGQSTSKPATSGSTEVSTGGSTTTAAGIAEDEKAKKEISEVTLSAGGVFAAGNSRSMAVTGAVKSKIKREDHQFTGAAAFNYANSGKGTDALSETVNNIQALLRYDYYFTKRFAVYAQVGARRDLFQGLQLRLNAGPGVAYYFVQDPKRKFFGEAGYDLQYDLRDPTQLTDAKTGATVPRDATIHNARFFLGFEDKVVDGVQIIADFEFLQALNNVVVSTGTASFPEVFRFVFNTGVKATLVKHLAIATTVQIRYENRPMPGIQNTDVTTAIALVYNLF